jgi:hypothetical protein
MYLQRSFFLSISFLLLLFCFMPLAKAQRVIADIPAAFNAIGLTPRLVHLNSERISLPQGGHFQGIQLLTDSQYIITSSSATYAYYMRVRGHEADAIQKITESPLSHAGGCQIYEQRMIVGVEDNHSKDKSDIIMITFDASGRQIGQSNIVHRSGTLKRSTAGATGYTKTKDGRYLIAVGDWSSKNIDFYMSRAGSDTLFDSLTTFHAPETGKWRAYQTLNLLTDISGKIYLISLGLDGFNNRADLFEVNIDSHQANLRLLSTRIFKCKAHAGFRYASGINVSAENKLTIYSYGMKLNAAINIFQ